MSIDKSEVLRYLGGSAGADGDAVSPLIDHCASLCESTARPRYTYKIFNAIHTSAGVVVGDTDFNLVGRDISTHLKGAKKCALLAVTLGADTDALISTLSATGELAKATAVDACATVLCEQICDIACREIGDVAEKENLKTGCRFSAGYGDFSLSHQSSILRILDAHRKIGLTCTDSMIMIPGKSITAVIGLYPKKTKFTPLYSCNSCNMRDTCLFRKSDKQ